MPKRTSTKPRRRKNTSKKGRKPYAKNRMTKKRSAPQPKKQPFSHYERTNMKYTYNNDLVSSTTQNLSGTEFAFSLNDINKPYYNQASGDYLPMGHSQYRAVFNKFKVYSTKLDLVFNPNMTGKQVTLLVMLNSSQNLANTVQNVNAQSNTGLQRVWTYVLPTDKKFKFSKYVSITALESIKKNQFDCDLTYYHGTPTNSAALINASGPARKPTFKFSLINETDNVAVQIPFEMNISYYTTWYDRHRMPQSQTTV